MNGWADPEPAWWLNLQAHPEATVELPGGIRKVTARAAEGRSGRGCGRVLALGSSAFTDASAALDPARRRSSCWSLGSSKPHDAPSRRIRCGKPPHRGVTVVALDTGEILSTHLIEPDRRYWRNQRRDPGRWPGSQATG